MLPDLNDSETISFEQDDNWLKSLCLNNYQNELVVSSGSMYPAKLVVLDKQTLEKKNNLLFDTYYSSRFCELIEHQNHIYALIKGQENALLKLSKSDYSILGSVYFNQDLVPEDILFVNNDRIIIMFSEHLELYSTQNLALEDSIELQQAYGSALDAVFDFQRSMIIVCTSKGKIIKYAVDPLNELGELCICSENCNINSALIVQEFDRLYLSLEEGLPSTAKVAQIGLEDFEIIDTLSLPSPCFSVNKMLFDPVRQVVVAGSSYTIGGFSALSVDEFQMLSSYGFGELTSRIQDGVYDNSNGKMIWCNGDSSGLLIEHRSDRKEIICGISTDLNQEARIHNLKVYSHFPDGNMSCAMYDSNRKLVWESSVEQNTVYNDWICFSVANGTPKQVELIPNTYWLVFQIDSTEDVPSVHPGSPGDGMMQKQAFGPFPDTLHFAEYTSDRWAIHAEWEHLYPTATPAATATPEPTPTATPECSPTPTANASATPEPTATSIPGVDLQLSKTVFYAGDIFDLKAGLTPDGAWNDPLNLWVILDVWGAFWYGPAWTEIPSFYDIGPLMEYRSEQILRFTWPAAGGTAEGIRIWGALTNTGNTRLIGQYDCVEFGYSSGTGAGRPAN